MNDNNVEENVVEENTPEAVSPLQEPLPEMPEVTPGLENATSEEDEVLSEGDVA